MGGGAGVVMTPWMVIDETVLFAPALCLDVRNGVAISTSSPRVGKRHIASLVSFLRSGFSGCDQCVGCGRCYAFETNRVTFSRI